MHNTTIEMFAPLKADARTADGQFFESTRRTQSDDGEQNCLVCSFQFGNELIVARDGVEAIDCLFEDRTRRG